MKVKRSEQRLQLRGSQDSPGGMMMPKLRPRRLGWQRLHGVGVLHASLSAGSPNPEPANFSGCWGACVCVCGVDTISGSGLTSSLLLPDLYSFVSRGCEGHCPFPELGLCSAEAGQPSPSPRGRASLEFKGIQGSGVGGWGTAGSAQPSCSLNGRRGGSLSP